MKVLVTGAAGFIGVHAARALLNRGDKVIGFDNLSPYYDVNLKKARLAQLEEDQRFSFVKGNLDDQGAVEKLFAEHRPQRVIHLAAQAGVRHSLTHPQDYAQSNLGGFSPFWKRAGITMWSTSCVCVIEFRLRRQHASREPAWAPRSVKQKAATVQPRLASSGSCLIR